MADDVADTRDMPHHEVPDLGPAVLMDQLQVMVFDYLAAVKSDDLDVEHLSREITQLRRGLP